MNGCADLSRVLWAILQIDTNRSMRLGYFIELVSLELNLQVGNGYKNSNNHITSKALGMKGNES